MPRLPSYFLVFFLFLTSTGGAGAGDDSLVESFRLLARGTVAAALEHLAGAAGVRADIIAGQAWLQAGRIERAQQSFTRAHKRAGANDSLRTQALFGLAECRARRRQFARAEKMFRQALETVLSPRRRQRLVERLRLLAAEKLDPPRHEQADPTAAEQLLRAALDLAVPGPLADTINLHIGTALASQGKRRAASDWLMNFATRHRNSPRAGQALLQAARYLLREGDTRAARQALEDLLARRAPASLAEEATFLLSRTFGFPRPQNGQDLYTGLAVCRTFLQRFPHSRHAGKLRLEMALAPLAAGHPALAAAALQEYLATGSPAADLAEARFRLAMSLLGQLQYRQARQAFNDFIRRHPQDRHWLEARNRVQDIDWALAEQARREKKFADAARLYEKFNQDYPAAGRAATALLQAVDCLEEINQRQRAEKLLGKITSRHHQSIEACRAWYRLGIYAEQREDFRAARRLLQKAVDCNQPGIPAQARLEALDKPTLHVSKHQVFRTGHPPRLTVRVRNIKKLTVRLYSVDSEDFFRDRLGMELVTDLDIALCQPERTLGVAVRDYRPHRLIEQQLQLPLRRPGLYLVNISGGGLEASTAVRFSDLDIAVRQSGNQLFVFAQDLRRLRPLAHVQLLVSDGERLLFSGRTAADGTWSVPLGEEQDGRHLKVLARRGRQVAWLSTPPRTWYQPLRHQARAILVPARPAYRPGERLQMAGFVRDRQGTDGSLSFRPGDEFQLEMHGPQGLVVERRRVVLDDYGMFTAEFVLAADSPAGPYGFNLLRRGRVMTSTTVQVGPLRLPPYRLEIVLDNKVLTRGQALTGTILVRHPTGVAIVEQQLRYGLEGTTHWQEGRTDNQGRLRFSLDTRAIADTRRLALVARLPRHNLEARVPVLVTARDFSITVGVPEVLRSGQPGELSLRLEGADGSPRSGEVELEVVRQEGDQLAPVLRRRLPVGEAGRQVVITLPQKGLYLVRALATDSHDNPVFNEVTLTVEGAEQSPLLLDVTSSRVAPGQAVEVRIDSRLPRALALLTAETDRVVAFRVVSLRRGTNRVSFPSPGAVSEFNLQMTALHGTKHSSAGRRIRVEQRLQLRVRTDRREYHPGDEVVLTASAHDSAGRPADVGLVLAVVDEKLFAAYPERIPGMLATFAPRQRLGVFYLRCSNDQSFPAVVGRAPEQPEVTEAEGSAAMAALSQTRRVLTERATKRFGEMAKVQTLEGGTGGSGYGSGGLGLAGRGAGGGGAAIHTGRARVAPRRFLRQFLALTAAFFPRLRTGPDGVVTVRFRLPHTLTSWRIAGRALGRRTGAGEYTGNIPVRAPLWVELVAPEQLTAGDSWLPGARLFNNTRRTRQANLQLTAAGRVFNRQVRLPPLAQAEIFFPEIEVPENLVGKEQVIELSASSDNLQDRLRRRLAVQAAGFRQQLTFAGLLNKSKRLEFAVPEEWNNPSLQVRLDPVHQGLLLLDRLDPLLFGRRPELALLLEHLWQASAATVTGQRELLATRLRQALLQLCRLQKSTGSFSWSGPGPSSLLASARAVRALARARRLASRIHWLFPDEQFTRALQSLGKQLAGLSPRQQALRAEVLYSLAVADRQLVPALMLDRLDRLRRQLPLAAQALLGLTWHELGRPEKARDLAQLVRRGLTANRSAVDTGLARVLHLLAVVQPDRPWPAAAAERLLAITAAGMGDPGLIAAAAAALSARLATAPQSGAGKLQLVLDGQPLPELLLGQHQQQVRPLELAAGKLSAGKHILQLRLQGQGPLPYLVTVSGHRRQAPVTNRESPLSLRRLLEPVPLPYRGREIAAGFSVAEPGSKRWERPVERLPAGQQLQVTVHLEHRAGPSTGPLILEDNIPAGLVLVPGSVTGRSLHHRQRGNQLVFLLPAGNGSWSIAYRLRALNPGRFHFQPAQLLAYLAPAARAYLPTKPVTVDRPGEAPPPVQPTPDELYQRGRAASEMQDWRAALDLLERLYNSVPLRAEITRQVLADLLLAAIAVGDAERMVRYFELAKEKNPELVVPFDKIPPLQDAYRQLGAFEAGLRLDRGVADATLLSELHLVGVLEGCDELAEALNLFRSQLNIFPASETLAQALYSFSQVIYDRADRARDQGPPPGFDRASLLDQVIDLQARFAGLFPGNPDFPAAVYSLASAQLERGRPGAAAAWCDAGLRRGGDNGLADELAYLRAFATFRDGDYDRALELCQQVQQHSEDTESREMATYIMAQIYHARGQLQRALPLYRKVRDRFRDAAETLIEVQRQSLQAPQVVTVSRRRPVLTVLSRNIDSITLRAFRIDPMRLLLSKNHLDGMEEVNLSGIHPVVSRHLKIDGAALVARETDLALPLRQRGAYLVILRGGNQVASSLVLVEGLQLQVSPVSGGGRLRLQVQRSSGGPAAGARIQVLADEGTRLVVGQADLRGVFVTADISGPVTAVAELDGAFGMLLPSSTPEKDEEGEESLQEYEFEDDNFEGQLSRPGKNNRPGKARDFFKQDVKGVSAQQAM